MDNIKEPLEQFMEHAAERTFGRNRKECWDAGLCLNCGLPALERCYSEAGRKEYALSCICEMCTDAIASSEADV